MTDLCSIEGCAKAIKRRNPNNWCPMHYSRWARHGDPLIRNGVVYHADPRVRFMEQVEVDPSGCWLWTGPVDLNGYGVVHVEGSSSTHKAHRVAYEWFRSPIPDGLVLDHVHANGCRHHNCVNWVDHLEPVTQAENLRRAREVHVRTECGAGHPWTPENTYIQPGNGRRVCRTCGNASTRRWHAKQRAKRAS